MPVLRSTINIKTNKESCLTSCQYHELHRLADVKFYRRRTGFQRLHVLISDYAWTEIQFMQLVSSFEPPHNKTNKVACAPSEDSDQPGHPPSLIRVFPVRLMGS